MIMLRKYKIIENQWASLYGKNLSSTDMAFALSVRTLDYMKDYSYWFSKEVGLQQRGPWELKKDYVEVEKGKQVYIIPAGREINKVPPQLHKQLYLLIMQVLMLVLVVVMLRLAVVELAQDLLVDFIQCQHMILYYYLLT